LLVLRVWNISPQSLAAAINFLPNFIAIALVQAVLSVRIATSSIVEVCVDNNVITFLSSIVAILVWRPAVEEWQYRSVLDKLLFVIPRWVVARWRSSQPSIPTNETTTSVKAAKDLPISNQTQKIDKGDRNTTSAFNTPATKTEDTDTQFLPSESTRIFLGSLLFATTRLGWLSSDPTDTVALSNSPYGFTVGFLQSLWSIVSTNESVVEIPRNLRISILLLAIHQTVSTFLVAQHIFAGIYRQRGLAASVGAHIAWTVGKITIPFRLLWKFWQITSTSVRRMSYEGSPEVEADSDSTFVSADD